LKPKASLNPKKKETTKETNTDQFAKRFAFAEWRFPGMAAIRRQWRLQLCQGRVDKNPGMG
jgi:hypothetical protein